MMSDYQMDNIYKYIEATESLLGVRKLRYCNEYLAIINNSTIVDFLFELLDGNYHDAIQISNFLEDIYIFPSAFGETPHSAILELDDKIDKLYKFKKMGDNLWTLPKYLPEDDSMLVPGHSLKYYEVSLSYVVHEILEINANGKYDEKFYENAKKSKDPAKYRHLKAALEICSDITNEEISLKSRINSEVK